ncbi:phosphonate C-P lyase system protein PhnG [Natronomonas sp. LN261]|jgi:alpha-D-ribose 1-methylphosphonate 5-triphosphate synthase subunit PhnG|uniref:phosphonate C-P lyase system protein PhnG n=1 Tax=Natronomonas sp. LN261 TaxID=2750669 RepID=UPI0015EF1632|nr:phosphonate C-P lyase system protein PhnG [Natronomonas sp. LN261]
MTDPHDRSDRFEMLAACDAETLVAHADAVVEGGTEVRILQAPTPQLVMQQVVEPVARQLFNLGEVLVTAAEVELDGEKGFAMRSGKAEKPALSGAVVDAAIESDHPRTAEMVASLSATATERERERRERWGETRETTVEFEEMEDHT